MGRVRQGLRTALLVGVVALTPLVAACDRGATDVQPRNVANSLPAPVIETTTVVPTTTTSPPTTVAPLAPHRVLARTTPTTAHPALTYNYEVQLPVETKVYVAPATTTTTTPRSTR